MQLRDWTKTHDHDFGALTKEMYEALEAGDHIKFKWHGNSDSDYIGRVETDRHGRKYYCPEHCYEDGVLSSTYEGMRYYNPLDTFYMFTEFAVEKPQNRVINSNL